jgi:hypothetical protein
MTTKRLILATAAFLISMPSQAEAAKGWKYEPLRSQREFHGNLLDPTNRYLGFSGPIGSGKSRALIYQTLFSAALNPGLPGLLAAPTYPMLRDATLQSMFDVLGEEEIDYRHAKSENVLYLPDPPFHGAKILCRSLDEFERLRGTNLAWFGIDELTYAPPEAWTRLEGRLRHPKATRRCGFAVWTPKGYDWVFEAFIGNPKPGYKVTLATPRENHYVNATGMYDALQAGYDERLYKQEVLGEYLSLTSGAAYYSFRREQNVRELPYDHRLPLCWSLDFNINPMCSVIAQIADNTDPMDFALTGKKSLEIRVLDEIFLRDSNTPEACEAFVEKCAQYTRPNPLVVYVYGDASGSARQRAVGSGANSDWAVIKEFFRHRREFRLSFKYKASNPAVKDRVGAVNAALCNSEGIRRLLIHPRCKNLVKDLEQVVFEQSKTILDQKTDPMLTHVSDALGYLTETEMGLRQAGGPRSIWVA